MSNRSSTACQARGMLRCAICVLMLTLAVRAAEEGSPLPHDDLSTGSESSAGLESPATVEAFLASDRPMVIAHRGFSGRAPENTLIAVRQAFEIGADMVEIDVTLTSDGEVIVIHDETLERTTDGRGRVLETPFALVRDLDAGSWFDSDFAGEPVPTLDQVLALVAGRILLNIEIKTEAVTDDAAGGIAGKVARLVRARDLSDQVLVSSFDPRALIHLRQLAPEIRTASLYSQELHRKMSPSEITGQVGSVYFNVSGRHLDAEMLADLEAEGLPVAVYTVNRREDMRRLLDLGVDALFTDHPDLLLEVLGR